MDPLVIPIVALLIPIIIVPTAMGIKHARYLREVEHAERMRAMELGRPSVEEHAKSPMGVAGQIGVGVPLGAMFIAFIAVSKQGPSETIWMAAATIGVAGVVCGSILAALRICGSILASLRMKAGQDQAAPVVAKPAYDPDEFDVVGSRVDQRPY